MQPKRDRRIVGTLGEGERDRDAGFVEIREVIIELCWQLLLTTKTTY